MPSKKEKGEFDPVDHSVSAAVSSQIVSDAKDATRAACSPRGIERPRRRVSFGGEKVKTVHANFANILFLEITMQDALWIAVTIAFFVLSIAYVNFCEHVK
jgi:hypothetical protein